jgi:aspartate aminotransferase
MDWVSNAFAKRLSAVIPSVTLAVNAKASALRAQGVDIFGFGVGEPDFDPPHFVLDAAKKAIDAGAHKYTAVTGIPTLKQAICADHRRRRGVDAKPENVCVSVGAKQALFNVAIALYEPGDEVIIPTPCWVSYPEQVRLAGAEPVLVPTREEDDWLLSGEALSRALTPRTKAVVLCTPSNPTGAAYSEERMRELAVALRAHDCWIVVDEIYAELVYDGFRHVSIATIAPDLAGRTVIVDGVSKTYAMTGWRIGWTIAPKPLIDALDLVQGQSTTNAAAVAQHAAVAALTGPQDTVEAMRRKFEQRRGVMVTGLNSVPGIRCRTPEGAFYAFADCRGMYGIEHGGSAIKSDEEVAFFLLDRAHVAAVPGGAFGAPGYVRFSYATNEDRIEAGIASMRHAIATAKRIAEPGDAARP